MTRILATIDFLRFSLAVQTMAVTVSIPVECLSRPSSNPRPDRSILSQKLGRLGAKNASDDDLNEEAIDVM
jgi:hypothetical protein